MQEETVQAVDPRGGLVKGMKALIEKSFGERKLSSIVCPLTDIVKPLNNVPEDYLVTILPFAIKDVVFNFLSEHQSQEPDLAIHALVDKKESVIFEIYYKKGKK